MGQTLTHGVYLPDEGERNCYNGLAANWQLLDRSIGTVAEHTTQIAGKANAVHTHTKSDITDFPAYGTTAGTICEGNDSRLSDARTPVAHTHTKSDVTDLFNTDNTYSANQNFKNSGWEQGVTPVNLASLYLQFIDKNNSSFGAIGFHQDSSGYTFLNILAGDKYANGAKSTNGSLIRNQFRIGTTSTGITYQSFDGYWGSSLTPLTNNTYDLGSSSYQWNNLYAKNYYYNGTQWGLDQVNTWTGINVYTNSLWHRTAQSIDIVNNPTEMITGQGVAFWDNSRYWASFDPQWLTSGAFRLSLGISNYATSGAQGWWAATVWDISKDFGTLNVFSTHGNTNLGTSTFKWRTLNGVNPGALSLPSTSFTSIIESITDRNFGANYYTAPSDGYVCAGSMASSLQISNDTLGFGTTGATGQDGYASAYIPVRAGNTVRIQVKQTSTDYQYFHFYPATGNVQGE